MSLSGAELRLAAAELAVLAGARVQRAWAPSARTALLHLRLPGRSLLLRLDADPGLARAGLVSGRPRSPERPLAFQGLLRAHLAGARLDHVGALAAERVLELRFSTDDGERLLLAELRPRGGLLALAKGDATLLGVSPPSPEDEGRGLAAGSVWSPPPALPEGAVRPEVADTTGEFPVSEAVERLYEAGEERERLRAGRARVLPSLRAARRRLQRTLEKVRADAARIAEADRFRRMGDLLKPELHRLRRGETVARVTEYGEAGAVPVEVPLLPHLSPHANMERYYHLHRRLSRAAGLVQAREQELRARLARCEELLALAEAAPDAEALDALETRVREAGFGAPVRAARPASGGPAQRVPWREFRSATGRRILVGRTAEDNDALTFGHARGNDLWIHARGVPGSHVVVPIAEGEADGETQLDAATLAVYFSRRRDDASSEVAMTRVKHVRKPRDAAPGSVRYSQERTVLLRMEPARVARLLHSESAGVEPAAGQESR